jgi:hypothetical protein
MMCTAPLFITGQKINFKGCYGNSIALGEVVRRRSMKLVG